MSIVRPLRVLHAIPAFQMGGAERAIVDLFTTLERRESIVFQLCVFRPPTYVYRGFAPRRALRCFEFDSSWRDLSAARKCIAALQDLIREFRPDILHTHLWLADLFGAAAAARTGVRHVCHIHNTWNWMASPRLGFRVRRALVRSWLRRSGASFIACSTAAGMYYRRHLRLNGAAITTVPYGVDIDVFAPEAGARAAAREIRIGTAGRFVPEKGHMDLIRVTAALQAQGVEVKLLIAGTGPLEADYRRLVEELGIQGQVGFCGLVEDVPAFYRSLDIYVQPSCTGEGLPLAILEALSCGCPVVATDVAGAGEAVVNNECGYIVRLHDQEMLLSAIGRLATDAELRVRFGETARKRVTQHFSIDRMSEAVLSVYQSILETA